MTNLAVHYERGLGVEQDLKESLKWLRKAVDLGDAQGLNNLGKFYEEGLAGLPVDYKKSLELYKAAAGQGATFAMNNIAQLYHLGHGVPKNIDTAVVWYKKAAARGNIVANIELGLLFDKGWNGGNVDPEQAAVSFLAALRAIERSRRGPRIEKLLFEDWQGISLPTRIIIMKKVKKSGHYDGNTDGDFTELFIAGLKAYRDSVP